MIKQHTEQEILEILKEMEIEPDMVDIWEDRDGDISIEARGMAPAGEREFKKSIIIITTIIITLTIAFGFYRLEKKNQELQQQINQLYEYNEKLDYHVSGLLEK